MWKFAGMGCDCIIDKAVLCAITRAAPLSRHLVILYRRFGGWFLVPIYIFASGEFVVSIIRPIRPLSIRLLDFPRFGAFPDPTQ